MLPDLGRLKQLLGRLRALELQLPAAGEAPVHESGRAAIRDEVKRIAQALHDHSYWDWSTPAYDQRHAG